MALLRALSVLVLLAVLALVLAKAGQNPVPVTLQWNGTYFSTTGPVAVTLGLLVLLTVFFLGQAGSWLMHLPSRLADFFHGRRRQSALQTLTEAFAQYALGNGVLAAKLIKKLTVEESEKPLLTLLRTQLGQLNAAEEEQGMKNPHIGQLVALAATRRAAATGDWSTVAKLTAKEYANGSKHPAFTVLRFKALVNRNDPELARFLPEIKPFLSKENYRLVSTVTATEIPTPQAGVLSQPWVKTFKQWLATAEETFPAPQTTPQTTSAQE